MKTNLLNKNIIAIPLENEKLVDNTLVYRTRMDYNSFEPTTGLPGSGAWLLPHKFYEKFSSGQSDILKMTVDRYDVSGTQVQEYHKEYDQVNTLIYSHNHSLPAARIQNGLASESAFSGFGTADASQGGWTISNTSALYPDADGKTGMGYWSANGNISKTGVPAGKYLLTYWIKNQTTAAGVTGASSNSSQVSSPDPGGWRFVQHTLTLNSTSTLTITADDPFVYLDELRLHPFDAMMATYSFNRNTKLVSGISDENSIPKKFEYDELLRLTGVRNYNNYYLKTLEYNYKTSGSTYNSVKARDVLTDAVTTVSAVNALTGANVRRQFDYFDDIGRAMQNIGVGQSPSSKDVILHHDYDSYSREPNQYLPFTYTIATPGAYLSTAASEQVSFYNSQFSSEGNYAKVVTEYENSPLSRVKKVTPQGSAFNSKPITYTYGCNTQSNEVRNFRTSNAWYSANTLNKVTVKNENGDSTVTYMDLLGLKIMEARNTVKTYYLYDDRQNIVQVIQPVASESGHSSPSNIHTTASVSNGSFVYTFDAYNRLSTKKIPSGGTTTYTYDRLDREVVRSDPNGFRFFTKYDILGRVILTGKHTTSSNPTGSEPLFETPTTTGYYYTTVAFPTSSIEVYAVNYYDDYDWEDNGSTDATYRGGYVDYPSSNYTWVKGKLTRSKNGRLNQNGTAPSAWIDDIIFYDIEGKEIQKQSLQQLGYTDTTWVQYDFPGRVRKTQRSHMNNTTRTLIVERFEYDHASRRIDTYHKINTQAEQKISNLSYNERDELLQKKLAYVGSAYGQTIDYAYNIRKWLTQINDPSSCGADLFSQKLYYTDANSSLNAAAKYNGNIAWMEWRTGANCLVGGVSRNKVGYGITYDGLDRVTASKYGEYTSSWTNLDRYNETITYDLNGNISTLVRRGYISSGNWNTIDNLTYTYDGTNTNRVSSIADGSGSTLGYPASSGSFTYDASGNQVSYGAKGISSITYNHLNLPTKYTWSGSNLEVQYDASGSKLKKIPSSGNAKTYVGNIEYSGTSIEAIYHSEGRARLISSTWEYEYAIKDHLGNARVYFKYNGSITFLQESHYYPFGMEQGGWTAPVSPENKYKYNSKEYNDDFSLGLYDYGARWYDPSVGRFSSVDPLSSKMPGWSTYAYGFNNPIRFIDPTGMAPDDPIYNKNGEKIGDDGKNNGQVYVVTGKVKSEVEKATKEGSNYSGDLKEGNNVANIPTGVVMEGVSNSVTATEQSQKENGGNAYKVVYAPIKWDEGSAATNAKDKDGNTIGAKASMTPFKVNGVDQTPKDASNLSTWWHVHPKTEVGGVKLGASNPSQADFNFQGLMQERGFKGNSFVVGTRDQKVTIFNADRIVVRMKYEVFKRIGSN